MGSITQKLMHMTGVIARRIGLSLRPLCLIAGIAE